MSRFPLLLLLPLVGCQGAADPPGRSLPASASTTDFSAYLGYVYRTVLNREPDPVGAAHWQSVLQGGLAPSELIPQLVAGTEFVALHPSYAGSKSQQVTVLYQVLLGRTPAANEVDTWAASSFA